MNKLLYVALILLAVLFFTNWWLYPRPISNVTDSEAQMIIAQLRARSAGDCVVVRTDYGFRCESLETGEVYKVKK
jgi:hypothetical protein